MGIKNGRQEKDISLHFTFKKNVKHGIIWNALIPDLMS